MAREWLDVMNKTYSVVYIIPISLLNNEADIKTIKYADAVPLYYPMEVCLKAITV